MDANLDISTYLLKFLAFDYVFRMRSAPEIVRRTIGFSVTPPAIVPMTTKAADPMLHQISAFLKYLSF